MHDAFEMYLRPRYQVILHKGRVRSAAKSFSGARRIASTIQRRRRPSTNVMQTRELLYAGLTGNRGKMAKLDLHRLLGARLPE